ncbi:HlyD family efflux transporter periplasmic adaptor subunit [Tropicimonas sp. TH_r6]|uniref:HlyD family secretion protein n=1 Tax=Tropicimonas sp. TH_r6 TaxID=3082085 RepID=UPI0029542940|nr:HlyD family efflux transporter periplasmic adaptor subunit [Tropicimonas sp. TH_r6]MDV7143149.1 HlyD family efflux transporter periplasmic adaptor subunit [Tropicimonas sp. TH_r6]
MKIRNVLFTAAVLLVAVGGYSWYSGRQPAPLPGDIAFGNGQVEAVQVDISSKIAGRVQEVLVSEGAVVEPDQVLARLDRRTLEATKAQAEATLASAEAQVAAAEAAVVQAKAQLTLTEQELARAQQLLAKGHSSQEVTDIRVSERDVAAANVSAAEAAVVSARRNVDAARFAVEEIDSTLEDTELVAPTRGRVLYRLVEPGEVVASGGKLLTMIDLSDVYLEFFLPATQAHLVAIGAEARIRLDIADVTVPATVTFVSPSSQFTPKQVETADERDKLMFRVKVRVPQELVEKYIDYVKTGLRGTAYVRLASEAPSDWPASLALTELDALPDLVKR